MDNIKVDFAEVATAAQSITSTYFTYPSTY